MTTHHVSRRTDSDTSHEAADLHERAGRLSGNKRLVYTAVCNRPGLTGCEIAKQIGMDRHEASRRLADVRREGLIHNGEQRRCSVKGNMQMTWWPMESGETPDGFLFDTRPEYE
jgi:CRP-like cAMP-binding protein